MHDLTQYALHCSRIMDGVIRTTSALAALPRVQPRLPTLLLLTTPCVQRKVPLSLTYDPAVLLNVLPNGAN